MMYIQRCKAFTEDALQSFRTLVSSARWVPTMYSRRGMRYMRYAVVIYLVANVFEQCAIYFGGQLIGNHRQVSPEQAAYEAAMIGAMWVTGIWLERFGHRVREWGWNLNDRGLYQNLTRGWLRKTPGEMMAEDRTVGPYQIDSCASSMHEMQFTLFFRLMGISMTLIATTGFVLYTSLAAGGTLIGILLGNLIAIFYINHFIHIRARVIDEQMRRWRNRLMEFLQNSIYIVGTGNELTVMRWLKRAQLQPYLDDFQLWGKWYPIVDGIRATVTNVALALLLWYGYWQWSTAELASIFAWILAYRQQFWQIADVQRNLARDAEKIHALRSEYSQVEHFDQGAFPN